jgi:hypothetical protein
MKAYICDCCGIAITKPYTVKMIAFFWACSDDIDGISAKKAKEKHKIHLCGNCFDGLRQISEKALKERSAGK